MTPGVPHEVCPRVTSGGRGWDRDRNGHVDQPFGRRAVLHSAQDPGFCDPPSRGVCPSRSLKPSLNYITHRLQVQLGCHRRNRGFVPGEQGRCRPSASLPRPDPSPSQQGRISRRFRHRDFSTISADRCPHAEELRGARVEETGGYCVVMITVSTAEAAVDMRRTIAWRLGPPRSRGGFTGTKTVLPGSGSGPRRRSHGSRRPGDVVAEPRALPVQHLTLHAHDSAHRDGGVEVEDVDGVSGLDLDVRRALRVLKGPGEVDAHAYPSPRTCRVALEPARGREPGGGGFPRTRVDRVGLRRVAQARRGPESLGGVRRISLRLSLGASPQLGALPVGPVGEAAGPPDQIGQTLAPGLGPG